jgi:hypothetical protein
MLVPALMVFSLSGCYSLGTAWRAQPFAPDQFVVAKQPRRIRITTTAGKQLVLDRPRVRNDSIVGRGSDGATGVLVQEVRRIETGTSKAVETAGRTIGIGVAGVLVGGVERVAASAVPGPIKFNKAAPKAGRKQKSPGGARAPAKRGRR